MIELNLQFFAKDGPGGEKTEEPTSKKLGDARKEGQVAKSKEVENAASLLVLFVMLRIVIGMVGENFIGVFRRCITSFLRWSQCMADSYLRRPFFRQFNL